MLGVSTELALSLLAQVLGHLVHHTLLGLELLGLDLELALQLRQLVVEIGVLAHQILLGLNTAVTRTVGGRCVVYHCEGVRVALLLDQIVLQVGGLLDGLQQHGLLLVQVGLELLDLVLLGLDLVLEVGALGKDALDLGLEGSDPLGLLLEVLLGRGEERHPVHRLF